MTEIAIYAGRECIGFVTQMAAQKFVAKTADGRKLGSFTEQTTAAKALSADAAKASAQA